MVGVVLLLEFMSVMIELAGIQQEGPFRDTKWMLIVESINIPNRERINIWAIILISSYVIKASSTIIFRITAVKQ